MEETLGPKLKEAETAVLEAERTYGTDHVELANALSKYAALLKQANNRALDAVNVEARAKAIRAKIYAAEAASHPTAAIAGKKWSGLENAPRPGAYFGLGAVALSIFSLILPQYCFIWVAVLSLGLISADIYLSKGLAWRSMLTGILLIGSWCAIQSVPPRILSDETPVNRWLYATENPSVIANVRKLGDSQRVLNFGICLPKGMTKTADERTDGSRIIQFKYDTPPVASSVAEFSVIQTSLPDNVLENIRRYSIVRLAKEVALPAVLESIHLDPASVDKQKPKMEDINGFDFAHFNFEGKMTTVNGRRVAFVYTMRNKNRLITFCGSDSLQTYGETLGVLESSLSTLTP